MNRDISAYFFKVIPAKKGQTSRIQDVIKEACSKPKHFGFEFNNHEFVAYEVGWREDHAMLSGAIYQRKRELPAALRGIKIDSLPIDENTDLGEPMCFAYKPSNGSALIHYAHTGPRHTVLIALIVQLGLDEVIHIEPVIRTDMLKELAKKKRITSMEYGITTPSQLKDLRSAGASVSQTMDIMEDLGGVSIKVTVTMAHSRGRSLNVEKIKSLAGKIINLNETTTLKVKGADNNCPLDELDLLKARWPAPNSCTSRYESLGLIR